MDDFKKNFAGLNALGNILGEMEKSYNAWMSRHKELDTTAKKKNKLIARLRVVYETIDRCILDSIRLRRLNREALRLILDGRGNEAVAIMKGIESDTIEIEKEHKLDFTYYAETTESSEAA